MAGVSGSAATVGEGEGYDTQDCSQDLPDTGSSPDTEDEWEGHGTSRKKQG